MILQCCRRWAALSRPRRTPSGLGAGSFPTLPASRHTHFILFLQGQRLESPSSIYTTFLASSCSCFSRRSGSSVASLLKHKYAALRFVANKYLTKGNADARLFCVRCCHPRLRALSLSPPSRHGPLFPGSRSHDLGGWRNVLEEGCRN
jgi:hypothetical protein